MYICPRILSLINTGSVKLNLVKNKALKIDEQSKIDNAASNESTDFISKGKVDQEMEEICWPREQKDEKHAPSQVTVLKFCQHQKRQATQLPSLPVSQEDIYKQLAAEGLISPVPTRHWAPPYPVWYDPNVKCAYHSEVSGHSTENCIRLRQRIYELINAGSIKLNLVKKEILVTKDQTKINFIQKGEDDQEAEEIYWRREQKDKRQASSPVTVLKRCQLQKRQSIQLPPLPVPQEDIYKQLVAEGLLSPIPTRPWNPPYPTWYNPNVKCIFHSNVAGHSTENCIKLRQKINELISAGILKLIPVERESLETNDQRRINNETSKESISFIRKGEDDLEIEKICWPGKHREDTHVAIVGDNPILPNIGKI